MTNFDAGGKAVKDQAASLGFENADQIGKLFEVGGSAVNCSSEMALKIFGELEDFFLGACMDDDSGGTEMFGRDAGICDECGQVDFVERRGGGSLRPAGGFSDGGWLKGERFFAMRNFGAERRGDAGSQKCERRRVGNFGTERGQKHGQGIVVENEDETRLGAELAGAESEGSV